MDSPIDFLAVTHGSPGWWAGPDSSVPPGDSGSRAQARGPAPLRRPEQHLAWSSSCRTGADMKRAERRAEAVLQKSNVRGALAQMWVYFVGM